MAGSRRICILGNYSGRNAGDIAILAGMLHEISSHFDGIEFVVPTLNPRFIRETFGKYAIETVSLLPWRGSIKLLGFPAWRAICSSDLVLITDAILFDHRLWNPMHNYLSSLALLIPQAKQRGLPIALYNASVGPIHTPAGRWCLTRVLRHSDLLILRDEDSLDHLAGSQPISARIERGADSALSAAVADPEQVAQILARHGISSDARTRIGININCYGDTYVRARSSSDFTQERLLSTLASTAEWIQGELGADVWLIGTQHMDLDILRNLRRRIGSGRIPLFTNRELGYAQIAGLLAQLDLLIGMRTHSLILASSVGTPVLGIVAYPKTYGYLERIGLEKQTIGVRELELDALRALIRRSWEQRATLRRDIRDAVERERKLASAAPAFLAPYLQR